MAAPEQGGRVVLNAGAPGADFYLDGNFVAVTDENGMLTMENFPAGSFSYSIIKRGYNSYKGSFSISEGETKRLSPVLEKIRETAEPQEKAAKGLRKAKPMVNVPQTAGTAKGAGEAAPQIRPEKSNAGTAGLTAELTSSEEPEPSPLFLLLVLLVIASLSVGFWKWRKKRIIAEIPPLVITTETDTPQPAADASIRPAPGFIDELRRREELMNAGFVGSKPRVADQESMKDKEVVIVLPKEAFRYEDDK